MYYRVTVCTMRTLLRVFRYLFHTRYTDADPYKLIYVDPNDIQYVTDASKRRGWVVDGTWDQTERRFINRTVPQSIHQRYRDGIPWDETILSDWAQSQGSAASSYEDIESLYRRIESSGYKTQQQLLQDVPELAWDGLNDAMHPAVNEITVDIGRDGQLLWNMGGQHRLAIAQVLELERIPVQVMRRHARWQTIRDNFQAGEESVVTEYIDHPDLQDV